MVVGDTPRWRTVAHGGETCMSFMCAAKRDRERPRGRRLAWEGHRHEGSYWWPEVRLDAERKNQLGRGLHE